MILVVRSVRVLAVLCGTFLILASALDLLGLVAYSAEMPTLAHRTFRSVPLGLAGAAFLFPYRSVQSARMRVFGIVVLSTVVAWSLYLAVTGTHGYLVGAKSWHVLPTAAALMAITIANGWAFLQVTRGRRGGAWSGC